MKRFFAALRGTPTFVRVFLPGVATVLLILGANLHIVVPLVRESLLERKKASIHSLTVSMWSLLDHLQEEVEVGRISLAEAQREAINHIREIRYGPQDKDYFWIHDLNLTMQMHPYRTDLEGKDLSTYQDRTGKHLFVEMTEKVLEEGEGYVEYYWQWQDQEERIKKKLSFVKLFEPWGWIVGTGVYLEDVRAEIAGLTRRITFISLGVFLVLLAAVLYSAAQHYRVRRQAAATRSQLNLMMRALERTPEGIVLVDGEGRIQYANRGATQLQRHREAEEELEGRLFSTLLAEKGAATYRGEALPALRRDEAFHGEFTYRREDGSTYPGSTIITNISGEGLPGHFMLISWRDISDRVRAEQALRDSERRFRSIVENSSDAILVVQEERAVLYNPRFLEIVGLTQGDLSGRQINVLELIHPDDRELVRKRLERRLRGEEEPLTYSVRALRADGEEREIEVSASRIDWEESRAVLVLVRDITEASKAEQMQREAIQLTERSAKLASIGVIAAGITHEINQPLNAIRMGADGILLWNQRHDHALDPFVAQTVERIATGAGRITEIINHMRRYWVEKLPDELDLVDLNASVRSAVDLIATQANRHGVAVLTRFEEEEIHVRGIEIQLEQIVLNLLSNAIQALEEGGAETPTILVDTKSLDGQAVLRVQDNGPGLDIQDPEELWNPFYSTRSEGRGMGLGLAIVKMFVDRIGGVVTAGARPDGEQGTLFEVRLQKEQAGEDAT